MVLARPSGLAWSARLLLDGEPVSAMAIGAGAPAGSYQTLNDGPIAVRGGRHTLTIEADPTGQVPESVESDNTWSGQFVWSPLPLMAGEALLRPAPPERGTGAEPNSDGFSFAPPAGRVGDLCCPPQNYVPKVNRRARAGAAPSTNRNPRRCNARPIDSFNQPGTGELEVWSRPRKPNSGKGDIEC